MCSIVTYISPEHAITLPRTTVLIKRLAPNIDPIINGIPSTFSPAVKDAITSGAPFANANNVTPASV